MMPHQVFAMITHFHSPYLVWPFDISSSPLSPKKSNSVSFYVSFGKPNQKSAAKRTSFYGSSEFAVEISVSLFNLHPFFITIRTGGFTISSCHSNDPEVLTVVTRSSERAQSRRFVIFTRNLSSVHISFSRPYCALCFWHLFGEYYP